MQTTVVILNGASSVGKTSTAKAIQQFAFGAFMHLQMDSFLEMLPRRLDNHADGLLFENVGDEHCPEIAVSSGHVLEKLMAGMRGAVAAMAGHGSNIIVDDVFWNQRDFDEYRRLLSEFDPKFVLLDAPLDTLEHRERSRGDRTLGLARWQSERVRRLQGYDLIIDTSHSNTETRAKEIIAAFNL